MADNEEDIVVTADVSDLKAQLRDAQKELRGFNATMAEMQAYSDRGAAAAASLAKPLADLSAQADATRVKIAGLKTALEAGGGNAGAAAVEGSTKAMGGLNLATAGVTREFIVLGHEAMVGNFSRIPGSLLVLTERMGGLNLAALGVIGAVAAVTGVLGYLAYSAVEAGNAMDHIGISAEFTNNINLSKAQIQGFVDKLDALQGVSKKDAEETVAAFAGMKDGTVESITAMVAVFGQYMAVQDGTAKETREKLIKSFTDAGTTAVEFAAQFRSTTAAQLAAAQQADETGNAYQVQASKLGILSGQLDEVNPRVRENAAGMFASFTNMMSYIGALGEGISYEEQFNGILKDQNAQWAENKRLIDDARYALTQEAKTPGQVYEQGAKAGKKEDPNQYRVQETLQDIGKIKAALQEARDAGNQVDISKFTQDLAVARQNLQNLQIGPIMQRARESVTALEATWKGSKSSMLQAEQNLWATYLPLVQKNSAQYYEILTNMHRGETNENKAAESEATKHGNAMIAAAREQVSEIAADDNKTKEQQLQSAVQVWNDLLSGTKLNANQIIQVKRDLNNAIAALNREETSTQNAINAQNAATQSQLSKNTIAQKKSDLDVDVALLRISEDQKITILKQLTQEEAAQDLKSLQDKQATYAEGTKEYNDYTNKILLLQSKLNTDLSNLDRQRMLANINSWKQELAPISQSITSMFTDMGQAGQTFGQKMSSVAASMVNSFVSSRIRIETDWLAGQLAMGMGADQWANFSLLQWVATELGIKTAKEGTSASEIADKTATAATVSGITTASSIGEIMSYAAVAAAAAIASTAAIPVIGPALAPAAGAAAYGEASAWAAAVGVPGLAVGTLDVPQDMLAQIHKGEMVVPRTFADGLRSSFGGGSGGGEVHLHGPFVSAIDSRSGMQFLQSMVPALAKMLQQHLQYNPSAR